MIAHTISSALKSKKISRVIVSTDDIKIANISKNYGAEVPFLRPKKLSSDNAYVIDTYFHVLDNLYIKEAYVGKSVVLKRFRARAKGRASAIKKPYSNITIILSEKINKKEELHGTKS